MCGYKTYTTHHIQQQQQLTLLESQKNTHTHTHTLGRTRRKGMDGFHQVIQTMKKKKKKKEEEEGGGGRGRWRRRRRRRRRRATFRWGSGCHWRTRRLRSFVSDLIAAKLQVPVDTGWSTTERRHCVVVAVVPFHNCTTQSCNTQGKTH